MTRPTRDDMFMQLAQVVAQRSTCGRAKVGCIITNSDGTSIVSMGYNGNARGQPDRCDTDAVGNCGCLHAEENALLKAPYGPELVMYTLTSPCLACAKRILNSSVRRVLFKQQYRDAAGTNLLRDSINPKMIIHRLDVEDVATSNAQLQARINQRDLIIMALLGKAEYRMMVLDERDIQKVQGKHLTIRPTSPGEQGHLSIHLAVGDR